MTLGLIVAGCYNANYCRFKAVMHLIAALKLKRKQLGFQGCGHLCVYLAIVCFLFNLKHIVRYEIFLCQYKYSHYAN